MTNTCTVRRPISEGGQQCGQPAVRAWISRVTGEEFGECVEHDLGDGQEVVALKVGDFVTVSHLGLLKRGKVVEMNGTQVKVEVPIHDGRDSKTITRSRASLL